MCKTILLAVFMLVASLAYPQSKEDTIHVMTKAEFTSYLEKLRTDVVRTKTALTNIDTAALDVDFKEGKLISEIKEDCLSKLEHVQESIAAVTDQPALVRQIGLLSFMHDFEASAGILSMQLTGLLSTRRPEVDSAKALQWEKEFLDAESEVAKANRKLFSHLLALAQIIDSRIAVPSLLR
jgi:hypothetical protein